jgi:hypothetical protein
MLGGAENRVSTLVINGGTVRLASGAGPLVLNSLSFGDLLGGLGGSAPASSATTPPASGAAAPAAVAREVAQADMVSPAPTAHETPAPVAVVTADAVLVQAFGMPLNVIRAGEGHPMAEADALAALGTLSTAPAVGTASGLAEASGVTASSGSVVWTVPSSGTSAEEGSALTEDGELVDVLSLEGLALPLGA